MLKKALVALALLLPVMGASLPASAQTAPPAVIGYYTTSGCPGSTIPCFIQYGASLPISGSVTPSNSVGITPTDRTVTSATGASQTIMTANASRHSLIIQNTGSSNCGVNPTGGTAVIGGAGTLTLSPGGSYQPRIPTLSAVTAICTAAQPLYAEEN